MPYPWAGRSGHPGSFTGKDPGRRWEQQGPPTRYTGKRFQRTQTKAEFVRETLNQETLVFQIRKAILSEKGEGIARRGGRGENP